MPRAEVRFGLLFVVLAGLLFSLYAFPYAEDGPWQRCFQAYLRSYARLAGGLLALVESSVQVSGNVIIGRYALRIVKTCDAMEANLLFLAAVIAFPAPWKRKAVAAAGGLAALVAINVVRICSLYFLGVHAPSLFETFHVEIWPLLIIGAAAADFAFWVRWMRSPARSPTPPAPPSPSSPLSAVAS